MTQPVIPVSTGVNLSFYRTMSPKEEMQRVMLLTYLYEGFKVGLVQEGGAIVEPFTRDGVKLGMMMNDWFKSPERRDHIWVVQLPMTPTGMSIYRRYTVVKVEASEIPLALWHNMIRGSDDVTYLATGDGNAYFWYELEEGMEPQSERELAEGVTLLGPGAYIAVPPSFGYTWGPGPFAMSKTTRKPKVGFDTDVSFEVLPGYLLE